MVSNPNDLLGQILSGYRLERILGVGATGAVFLGQRVDQPAAPVAIKVLILPWQTSDTDREAFQTRFRREAQALLELAHPNIPKLLGFGIETNYSYLILQYIDGGSLFSRLAQGPLSFDEIARYTQQLSAALDYAHSHNMIHRDIKPANVLLDSQGNAYLSDFSIVRLFTTDAQKSLTTTGQSIGTPEYMSPEQMRGAETGPTSDIYSLGLLVYQMVTGRVPFQGSSVVDIALKHAQEQPPYPRALRPDLPLPAEAAIIKALAKNPGDRFQTVAEFANAMTQGLQNRYTASNPVPTQNPTPVQTMMAANTSGQYIPQTATTPAPFPSAPAPAPTNTHPGATIPQALGPAQIYHAQPPQKKRSATPALLGLIVLLLIALVGVGYLGFSGKLSPGGGKAAGTNPTATTAASGSLSQTATTASATSTATVAANQTSYTAIAPGPSCDSGGGDWTIQHATVTCNSGQTTFAPTAFNSFGHLEFQWPGHAFTSDYTVSAQYDMSYWQNTGHPICSGIETHISGSASYVAEMCLTGYWYVIESGKTLASGNETIVQNGIYVLAVTVTGSAMKFTVNGSTAYTGNNSDITATSAVGLTVSEQSNLGNTYYATNVSGFTYQQNP